MSQDSLPDGVVDDAAQDSMDMSRLAIDDDPFASLDVPVDNHPLPAVVSSCCRRWCRRCDQHEQEQQE
jgi:hypothetical protein